ncbi:MAG: cohesin domain-containing protein [Patescibacteria group bacterium]|nr:cohesin domain-containing protein [Patescibacteria group bacterium]
MTKKIFIFWLIILSLTLTKLFNSKTAFAKASFTFVPESVNTAISEVELRLKVTEEVVGGDLDFTFDPKIVQIQEVVPGDFWETPQIITNFIDKEKGLVNFSLYSQTSKSGEGSLARIKIRIIKNNFTSSNLKLESSTLIANSQGKKVTLTLGQVQILPPQNLTAAPLSLAPTWGTSQPTIIVENFPVKTTSAGFPFFKILAIALIVLGLTLIIVFGFLWKKTPKNVE